MSIILVNKKPRPEAKQVHDSCFETVKVLIEKRGLPYESIDRSQLQHADLSDKFVITIGGDGTLLESSHQVKDGVILGVNSNPTDSVGSLCVADADNFEQVLEDYLDGALTPIKVSRIELSMNGAKLDRIALNDVLIANHNPAAMTRYYLKFNEKEVFHKNSGLWICAPMGSSGGVASAGGFVQPATDKRIQWQSREAYFATKLIPSMLSGFFQEPEKLEIISAMPEGKIFIDGPHNEYSFKEGDCLSLSHSKSYLNLVMTEDVEKKREEIGRLRGKYEIKNG